tara:strand:- start:2027 stop:2533 length:507 start_codon:yes stop_codon:yes gene_type:complete
MATIDTLTGQKVKETYTKLLQVNSNNELLDGIGGAVSPILTAGATITGSLNVEGTIYKNGVPVGTSTDSLWDENEDGELVRDSNVGIGINTPNAKLHVKGISSVSETEDFFIIKREYQDGGYSEERDVFKINNEGTMVLGAQTETPTAYAGAMYYNSSEDAFYLGYSD